MASELTTKVRLVRCPKCRLVLPELPEFHVYKCGGCGATLQAKNRVNHASTGSGVTDADAIQENQVNGVHEAKEELSLNNKVVLPVSGEFHPCESNERDQSRSEDCEDEKHLEDANLSSGDLNNGRHQSDSSDCDNEGSEVSNEIFSPTEFVDHKNEDFALNENDEHSNDGNESFAKDGNEGLAHVEDVDLADNKEETEIAHNESEEFAHDETEEFTHNENEEFTRGENEEFPQEVSRDEKEESTQNEKEEPARNEDEPSFLAGADLQVPVDHDSSSLAEANTVNTNKSDTDSDVRSSNAVNSFATMENGSRASDLEKGSKASPPMPVRESIATKSLVSSHREQLEQPRKSVHQGRANLKSEEFNLSRVLGDMSKSPTRSSHAYDGSISSYDGLDDQFPIHRLQSLEDTYKAVNSVHPEEQRRRGKFMARAMMDRESEMRHKGRPPLSEKKIRAMKNGKWDHDEFLEPARHVLPVRDWRLERYQHQPSLAFHQSASRASFENGGPSNWLHNEFHRRSSFQSHDLPDHHGQVMKLLRMVFEMQNQLDKSQTLDDKGNDGIEGLSRKTRYNPKYHNHEASSQEHFRHSDYPRYYGRYGSESNYSNRSRLKKIPFSGEAASRCHQVDPSCSHCFPQDWPRSAKLPLPSHYNTSRLCRNPPGYSYRTYYSSCPSSPQWSVDSEYPPWGHETQSDDQRRRTQDLTNYLRDKQHHLAKRHFRPVAGGAPFIVCYKCFKLLQLPADFLLFKRKCHRLRCGACSEVLEFSLENGSRIVPYTASPVENPPPSEAGDYVDEIDRRNMASTTQELNGDSVSWSNDYGYRKSFSTEGDPNSTTFSHTPLGRTFDKRILYGSEDFTPDSKELAPEPSQGKLKNRITRFESSGPSSESEKLPPRSTSPLHRLMGYSSPRAVIFGNDPSGIGPSSYSIKRSASRK